MNKKISPAVIGAFVLGAVALIVIAILVFGSGRLFRQTRNFVLYFDNSVNGLRIGAGQVEGRRDRLGQGYQVTG
jgi:paraquat-inducible protein B